MYKEIIRLFNRDTAFRLMKINLKIIDKLPFGKLFIKFRYKKEYKSAKRELLDLTFDNPIGIGPGLDKEARFYRPLIAYGFSFVDIGPVGADNIITTLSNLEADDNKTNVSICIEKDHLRCFTLAYDFADFFVFQIGDSFIFDVMDKILDARLTYDAYRPVLLRITHDMPEQQLESILDYCMINGVDGVVVAKAENVAFVHSYTCGKLPIIGYGGIRSAELAREMLDAGASLIEITTGLVLDGPSIASKILKQLENK